ncbi:integrase domain-containing protein [Burkholderia multivorans]|uniref:integrase domain-containing protein n=1 Tax=Burkholderia multivorans TaxID=87883 RepID=UPI0021BFF8A4|nr:integrase domain-containing protein [Burkholderia multivorans]UXZ60332.1 integrase domain-containing protein [Burkholderia multivorans]
MERAIGLSNQYGGKLVRKPDLKRAMERYHYVVRKVGMTDERAPHSLRYAYATEHLERQKAAGGVSTWLGHGDGRGTWVERLWASGAGRCGGEACISTSTRCP